MKFESIFILQKLYLIVKSDTGRLQLLLQTILCF